MDERKVEPVTVLDAGGAHGSTAPFATGTENVWVTFGARRILVPVEHLLREEDGAYRLPLRIADYSDPAADAVAVIPLAAETLEIEKRSRETAHVHIHKTVREEEEEVTLPLVRETVEIERVPVNRVVDAPVASRQDGDTLILPVLEEVLVVEKRLVLKEEVHIKMVRTETEKTERFTLRKEEVTVERVDARDEEKSR
jgi:uncharacterized protein (TIGR02271 family)